MKTSLAAAAAVLAFCLPLPAQNCQRTSVGLVPLSDLGTGTYQGFTGGLWGGGSNVPPPAHAAAGLAEAQAMQPLDAAGRPDPGGKIVLISIGMSNTTQEFSMWVPISNADQMRNAAVVVVDCAQGGQDARRISDPSAPYWTTVMGRLSNAGVTPEQVQAAWVKQAIAGPTGGFPAATRELQQLLGTISRILKQKFPSLRVTNLSSRIYAGYGTSALNPEPYAYESAFAVRWVIEDQIAGDPSLNFDPTRGPVVAPWLGWGPYLWADGLVPRGDGFIWECADFAPDGIHPSTAGRVKVAGLLDRFYTTDPIATAWYYAGTPNRRASLLPYGEGCPGANRPLQVRASMTPWIGNTGFHFGVRNAEPLVPAILFLAAGRASIPLDASCTLLVDPALLLAALGFQTNTGGQVVPSFPVPNDPALIGAFLPSQWLVLDPGAPGLRRFGGGAMTQGVEWRVGLQ